MPSNYRRTSESYSAARKKRRKLVIPILIVAALCVVGVGIFALNAFAQKPLEEKEVEKTPSSSALLDQGQNFTLKGAEEITLMINSFYVDEGTNLPAGEVSVEGAVNTGQEGSYVLTYTSGSQQLKRTVHVVNNRQMVMNLNGSQETYVKQGQPYIESGCHVIDQTEGNLTASVATVGEVNTATPGDYEVLYKVANSQGVQCVKKRTVHVVAQNEFVANTVGVPVLMYHYVYPDGNPPANEPYINNFINAADLESHLQYLVENNYYFPSFEELNAYVNGRIDLPEKSIILTFDDGEMGFLNYGIPLFEKYKVPATSFIIAVDGDAGDKVRNYASEYISFQSHSYAMHQAGGNTGHGGIISAMSKDAIVEDLKTAQSIVQNTEAFAYPFGDHTDTAHEAVKEAGVLCAFTTEYGFSCKGADTSHLPRVRINGDIGLGGFISSIS